MIEISINGEILDLPRGFSIDIEETSPVFNDVGSQSVPATVPASPRNNKALSYPCRPDTGERVNRDRCILTDGSLCRTGVVNVISASPGDGIEINIGFDNSTEYEKWRSKRLPNLGNLPVLKLEQGELREYIERIYKSANPAMDDLAVFPILVAKADNPDCYEFINRPGNDRLAIYSSVKRIIDGNVTDVRVPGDYGITPFVRVWRVIELIFDDIGYRIESNPFELDAELSRLVVLNNVADACCTGWLYYRDLLPTVTVESFLNALYVRFGLVYRLDSNARTASLVFVRDIVTKKTAADLTGFLSSPAKINYLNPQYVKLTAQTSIDGAKPVSSRFEDFIDGHDMEGIRFGNDVAGWGWNEERNDFEYDWPDYNEGPDYPDPDYPDPDYPDPDYPDPDYYTSRSMMSARNDIKPSSGMIAFEVSTCTWSKLDRTNGKVITSGPSFFDWDPATTGADVVELSSDDEWVPVGRVKSPVIGVNEIMPLFLVGSRHCHTYIKGNDTGDNEDNDTVETPLAFMFAFTQSSECQSATIGRFSPLTYQNENITFPDGTAHTLSLLFQFGNGLFARFWKEYDEILRHGNRELETSMHIDKKALDTLNPLSPVTVGNIRCLIDTLSYTLPSDKTVSTEIKLRTISTLGNYDIDSERNIPVLSFFDPVSYHLKWELESSDIDTVTDAAAGTGAALSEWYRQHPELMTQVPGPEWEPFRAVKSSVSLLLPTWETDPANEDLMWEGQRKYKAYFCSAVYSICPVIFNDADNPADYDLDSSVGTVTLKLKYSVWLVARMVRD